jgi:hypothetical protein
MVDYVVFLDRRGQDAEQPQLRPIRKDEASRRLLQENVWPPELPKHEERLQAIERLLTAELFVLTYNAFNPAIDLLEQLIQRGAA